MPAEQYKDSVGLSPRVRGNRRRDICGGRSDGEREVYPRVCGGTSASVPPDNVVSGLSPRVRGNRVTIQSRTGIPGSIPACAGEPQYGIVNTIL